MGHRAPSLWHSFQRGTTSLGKSQFSTQPYVIITPFSLVWCTYWEHDWAEAEAEAEAGCKKTSNGARDRFRERKLDALV